MVRLARLNPPGIAQHIIQRGNNRQICFSGEEDFSHYLAWLAEYAKRFGMDIHAYVLMTNHVHMLATPQGADSISNTMQSLGRQYVRYFNHSYRRSGTLWEGRYKSCLSATAIYRYIPLYRVESRQGGDGGRSSGLPVVELPRQRIGRGRVPSHASSGVRASGAIKGKSLEAYRALFAAPADGCMIKDIRDAVNKGLALGSDRFKDQIEANLKRRVRPATKGRPRKRPEDKRRQESLL